LRRRPEVVHQDVQAIVRNLSGLDLITLAAFQRIDKYEATQTGGSSEGPKPKHSISDPTGNRVVAKLSGRKVHDPVGQAIKEIDSTIFQIRRMTEVLCQQRDYVLNPRERHKDNIIQHCEACGREVAGTSSDRLRSGYCLKDYKSWLGEGKPSRTQFESKIKALSEAV